MIRTIVDPAYVKAVLKDAAKDGDAVDKATGEVIPGIDVYDTDGYVRFEISTEARDRMAALLSASELMALTRTPPRNPSRCSIGATMNEPLNPVQIESAIREASHAIARGVKACSDTYEKYLQERSMCTMSRLLRRT